MKRCCGLAHGHIKIQISGQGLGLYFVGNGEPSKASEQRIYKLHLNRSQYRAEIH